jgi:hypothetical protein
MSLASAMRARKKDSWGASMNSALEIALGTEEGIVAKREELTRRGTLSAKGIAEAMQAHIEKVARPALADVRERVRRDRAALDESRAALKPKKLTDPVAYLEAREIRDWLKGLDQTQLAHALLSKDANPDVLAAALASPTPLIPDEMRERLEERVHGKALAAITEREEGVEAVEAVVGYVEGVVATAVSGRS